MIHTLLHKKYFPFDKGIGFKTIMLALMLTSVYYCPGQDLTFNNFKLHYPPLSKKFDDSVSYPTLISAGTGAYTYKFVNMYFYEINVLPHISQKIYLETGLILYRTRYYDSVESTTELIYLNLYFHHRWDIKNRIFIYGGIGFSIAPISGFIANIKIRGDYKLNKTINLGIEIKKGFYFRNKSPWKYYLYPAISANLSINL
jgi:hypothetical protein